MAGHRDDGTFHEDKAHHAGRRVDKGSVAGFLIANGGTPTPKDPWKATPGTVLGDVSEGLPGEHTKAEGRIEGWEDMIRDDMNITGNAGNMYDEAYGPSDMTRRPSQGEWDNEDVYMVPEKKKCSCKGSGSCSCK